MASNSRQITLEILGDAKGISAASSQAQAALKSLEGAADGVGGKMGGLSGVLSNLKGSLGTELSGALGNATSQMGPLGGAVDGLVKSGGALVPVLGGATIALGAVAAAAKVSIGAYLDLATTVQKFKDITGASAQDSARLVAALDDVNVSAEAGAKAFGALAKNADSKAFQALGIELAKTKTGAVDLTGTFENVLKKLDGMSDPIARANVLNATFGKSWQEILPLIDKGAAGFERMLKANEKSGQILSEKDLQAAKDFKATMDELGDTFQKFVLQTGKFALPVVKVIVEDITKFGEGLDKAGGFVADLVQKMGPLGTVIKGAAVAVAAIPLALHEMVNISFDKVEHGLQRMVDLADKIAGPFVNFPDDVFHNKQSNVVRAIDGSVESLQKYIDKAKESSASLGDLGNVSEQMATVLGAATGSAKIFGSAIEDIGKSAERTQVEAAKLAKSINDADEKVRDARQKVADVAQASAEKIADAERKVAETKEAAADRYANAVERQKEVAAEGAERIADAERKVAEAAEKGAVAVAKAKRDAAEAIKKANQDIFDAEYAAQVAAAEGAQAIADAEKNVAEVAEETARRVAAADRDLVRAREDAAAAVKDALGRQVEAEERAQVRIEDATRAVSDAHRDAESAVSDALLRQQEVAEESAIRIADAEQRVAQAAEEGAERVKAAKESAAQAAEDAADRIAATEKSSADQVKGADKNVTQARKDRDKAIKDGAKDVTKAEKDYQEVLAKSGPNSQQARDAAERLAEARERAAERIADANDRVAEAEERATTAREKGEKDVAKAKADAAKSAEENAKKIEKAEKDAADGIKKAEADLAKARADATKAQTQAAADVAKANEEAAARIAAAEAGLESARKQNDTDRKKAADDVAKAEEEGRKKVEDAEGRLKDAQIQAGKDREDASNNLYRVIGENAAKEIKAQADVGKAYQEKAAAEVKGAEDVKTAEVNASKDREQASKDLKDVVAESEKANQKAVEETRKVAEGNIKAINEAVTQLGKDRVQAAKDAKGAEDDLNDAIDDQKLKLLEAKTNVGLLKDAYVSNVDTMIGKVRDLSREIGLIPNIPNVPSGGGSSGGGGASGDFGGGGDPIVTSSQTNGQTAAPTGTYAIGPDGQQVKVDFVVGGAGAGASIETGTAPSGPQGPGAFNGASAGITTTGTMPAAASSGSGTAGAPGPIQGPVAPTSGTITIAGHVLPKGSQYGASGDVDQPGGEMGTILRAIRITETGNKNVYNGLGKPWPGPASGVYQFIGSTWRGLRSSVGASQYEHAVLAPISVQHAAAMKMASDILGRHNGYVDAVPGCWFHEGIYNTPNRWNTLVDSIVGGSGNPGMTMAGYIRTWIRNYQGLGGKGKLSPAAQSLFKGGADVDVAGIAAGGIPTNVGTPGGDTGGAGAAAVMAGGGNTATIGDVNPNVNTLAVQGPPGSDAATMPSTYIAPNGINVSSMPATAGGANQVAAAAAAAARSEGEIARQRAAGAAIEARVMARRTEMLALEELANALRAEELAKAQGVTDEAELQRLHAEVITAQAKAAAAEEAKIKADRAAGVQSEASTAGSRSTGAQVEKEIQRIRAESQDISGQNTVAASATAGQNIIDASVAAGHNIVGAVDTAGQNIVAASAAAGAAAQAIQAVQVYVGDGHSADDAYGKNRATGYHAPDVTAPPSPGFVGAWNGKAWVPITSTPLVTVMQQSSTLPGIGTSNGTDSGSGRQSLAPDSPFRGDAATPVLDANGNPIGSATGSGDEIVDQIVKAPFVIQLDGKLMAEGLYQYTREIARRNGDRTADGAWRVTNR